MSPWPYDGRVLYLLSFAAPLYQCVVCSQVDLTSPRALPVTLASARGDSTRVLWSKLCCWTGPGGNEERAVDLILEGRVGSAAVQCGAAVASRAPATRGSGTDHVAKRPCCSQHDDASDSSGKGRRRSNPLLIDTLVTQRAFLYGFQTGLKQLQAVFPSRYRFLFPDHLPRTSLNRFTLQSRLLLSRKGDCAQCLPNGCFVCQASALFCTRSDTRRLFFPVDTSPTTRQRLVWRLWRGT